MWLGKSTNLTVQIPDFCTIHILTMCFYLYSVATKDNRYELKLYRANAKLLNSLQMPHSHRSICRAIPATGEFCVKNETNLY